MTPDKDIQARIDRIGQFDGQTVTLKGWLYNKRSSGKLKFLQVRDGSGTIQCVVFKGNVGPAVFDAAEALTQESSVKITGTVKKDERSPIGFELDVTDLLEISRAEEYPISPKEHGTAFLMDHRHLWLRSSRQHAVLKVRAEIIRLVREFFDDNGFVLLDAPIFTPSACEGTSTLFGVDYFDLKKCQT